MKLGPVRVIVINQEGEEVTRQTYDLSKSKGTAHWQKLWRWALHQNYSLQVTPQTQRDLNAKPEPERKLHRAFKSAGAILAEPHRR